MERHMTEGREQWQRQALRRQRAIATGLLLVMAALFVATHAAPAQDFWIALVKAGAEAALVGGLADWFAVTALFRRPLGLPIPHTALVPRKKDELAAGLAAFIERHFLAPDVIVDKLRSLDLVTMAAHWLAQRRNAEMVAERLLATLPVIMNALQDRELRRLVRRVAQAQLAKVDLAPLLGRVLRLLTENRQHHLLFDQALEMIHQLLVENRGRIHEMVGERSRWWVPRSIDRRMAQAIMSGLIDFLAELRDGSHPARQRFDEAVADLADRLEYSAEMRDAVERAKGQLLGSALVQDYLGSLWDEIRDALMRDLALPAPRSRRMLAGAFTALGRTVLEDAAIRDRLRLRFETLVTRFVVPWRREIGALIIEVIARWDARTVTERLELEVGRDLQFIRINGTIVGALVGCTLFLLSEAIF